MTVETARMLIVPNNNGLLPLPDTFPAGLRVSGSDFFEFMGYWTITT